jgi:hypothetical protein
MTRLGLPPPSPTSEAMLHIGPNHTSSKSSSTIWQPQRISTCNSLDLPFVLLALRLGKSAELTSRDQDVGISSLALNRRSSLCPVISPPLDKNHEPIMTIICIYLHYNYLFRLVYHEKGMEEYWATATHRGARARSQNWPGLGPHSHLFYVFYCKTCKPAKIKCLFGA